MDRRGLGIRRLGHEEEAYSQLENIGRCPPRSQAKKGPNRAKCKRKRAKLVPPAVSTDDKVQMTDAGTNGFYFLVSARCHRTGLRGALYGDKTRQTWLAELSEQARGASELVAVGCSG